MKIDNRTERSLATGSKILDLPRDLTAFVSTAGYCTLRQVSLLWLYILSVVPLAVPRLSNTIFFCQNEDHTWILFSFFTDR